MFGAALGDNRLDTAIAQRASMPLRVVTAIGVDHARSLQWVAAQPTNWRNRIDQRQQLRDIVNVRAGQDRRERRAIGVGDDVVLRTWSRAIGGVWPSFWPAPTARIDEESTAAREKSIWSAARSFASSNSCRRSHTPAACQSRSRRQQVTPEPQPISAGRSRQRSPVLRTNRMPVSAARFETGRRPGFFSRRGLGGGNNGSINVHSSSSMIGLAISSVSVVPMPEVNSSPRKLTAPPGLFETVSKYLHFHRPTFFPIVDSIVREGWSWVMDDLEGSYKGWRDFGKVARYKDWCARVLELRDLMEDNLRHAVSLRQIDSYLLSIMSVDGQGGLGLPQ